MDEDDADTKTRPLILVDNCLVDHRGHHLALATTLSFAARTLEIPTVIFSHRNFDPEFLSAEITLRRFFSRSVYETFAEKRGDLDLGIEIKDALREIVRQYPDGARILFHTADAYTYCALANWVSEELSAAELRLTNGRWDVHVVTPYEPKLMPGFALKGRTLHESLYTLSRLSRRDVSFHFWCETARLAEFYRRAYSMVTAVLALPSPQWALEGSDGAPLRKDKLLMTFLGAAREEKGVLELPRLAREIAARPELAERVMMRVQSSAPIVGFSPPAEAALDEIRTYPFVEIMEGNLNLEEYAREILSCDVMLLLYRATNYFARGSGIAMEALSCGKYILGSRGTFMEQLDHGGLVQIGDCPAEWADLVEAFAENIEATRERGARLGERMAERQSPSRYLSTMVDRERFRHHFHSMTAVDQSASGPMLVRFGR